MGAKTMEQYVEPSLSLQGLFGAWLRYRRPFQGPERAKNVAWLAGQLLEAWEGLSLGDIDEDRVLDRFESRRAAGLAGATLNAERAFLCGFFGWCRRKGYLKIESPMGVWPRQPDDSRRPKVSLSLAEENALCAEIRCLNREVVEDYIHFLNATGLRPVTVRRLHGRHVSIEGGWHYLNLPGKVLKNGRGLRMELSPAAVACLSSPLPPDDEPLFPGLPTREQLWRIVTQAARRAGLRHVTPYTFRATWVGRMSDQGATEREVMVTQGWKRANVLTAHYYPEIRGERLRELYRRVEGK